jgi:O-acetyl-ADP-ribose deacetylase (regulator of RNase III)
MNLCINQDILDVSEGIICHQVNTLGLMGAGLALRIRTKWPKVYNEYMASVPKLGHGQLIKVNNDLYVANLAAQDSISYTGKIVTKYGSFQHCLQRLYNVLLKKNLLELPVLFPYKIGCGLAGGDWNVVEKIIEQEFPNAIICKLEL